MNAVIDEFDAQQQQQKTIPLAKILINVIVYQFFLYASSFFIQSDESNIIWVDSFWIVNTTHVLSFTQFNSNTNNLI